METQGECICCHGKMTRAEQIAYKGRCEECWAYQSAPLLGTQVTVHRAPQPSSLKKARRNFKVGDG